MDNRTSLLGLAALIVSIVGVALYFVFHPIPAKAPTRPAVTTALTNPYVEKGPYYDIAANYPTSTPLAASANDSAISAIQSWIISTISDFKKTPDTGLAPGQRLSLEIKYLISSSPRTVSYIFTTYEDTGGAHGNAFFKTFTFDTRSGQELALADLFAPGSDYLDALSRIARAKLPSILQNAADTKMIAAGTTPEAKNFEHFFIDNGTLDILFDPYAVAAYAAGPQTLQIPLASLSNILKSEYRP